MAKQTLNDRGYTESAARPGDVSQRYLMHGEKNARELANDMKKEFNDTNVGVSEEI